jgi:hypothetical protein
VYLLLRKFTSVTGKFLSTRKALVFLNGFLVASLVYFYTEDSYEKKLFETLASCVRDATTDSVNKEEALLLNSLHLTYQLGSNRANIFNGKQIHSFKASVIHPVTYDLMTANGACGSFAYILSRLLNELNIPKRIAQMKVDGLYGGHILVEAKTAKGWVVLDGLYDLYFKKADGTLASFNDVQNNWNYYKTQVPANYDSRYNYRDVRYTNWDKIPVLMPAIKGILELSIGKEAAGHFSLRTSFLRKFHFLFEVTLVICLINLGVLIRRYARNNPDEVRKYFPFLYSNKRPLVVMATAKEERA